MQTETLYAAISQNAFSLKYASRWEAFLSHWWAMEMLALECAGEQA